KAASIGLGAEEYRHEQAHSDGYTGIEEIHFSAEQMADLWDGEVLADVSALDGVPVGAGLVVQSASGCALGRVTGQREFRLVRGDRELFGLSGRSAEQRLAIDLLLDPGVGIVSLGGRAGTGKSALALAAGLEAVLERGQHRKI